uniref:Uncharacterized protein n=1 Tax=Glossina palpalis gambiensis TaxID=67801 RepID=A0A1B0BJ67_9MUSC
MLTTSGWTLTIFFSLLYSKYRELLGSYNDQANAYIETLPAYMVHKDNGFNLEVKTQPTPAITADNGNGDDISDEQHNKETYLVCILED